jgi:hypothetical protein
MNSLLVIHRKMVTMKRSLCFRIVNGWRRTPASGPLSGPNVHHGLPLMFIASLSLCSLSESEHFLGCNVFG